MYISRKLSNEEAGGPYSTSRPQNNVEKTVLTPGGCRERGRQQGFSQSKRLKGMLREEADGGR